MIIIQLYKTLILPHINYVFLIWDDQPDTSTQLQKERLDLLH